MSFLLSAVGSQAFGIPYSSYWFGGHDGILYLDTITRVTFDSDPFS